MNDKVDKILNEYGVAADADDANDILNVFINGRVSQFFVNTDILTVEKTDELFVDIYEALNDGFTDIDMFFDYGLNYDGRVVLQGRDY